MNERGSNLLFQEKNDFETSFGVGSTIFRVSIHEASISRSVLARLSVGPSVRLSFHPTISLSVRLSVLPRYETEKLTNQRHHDSGNLENRERESGRASAQLNVAC